MALTGTLADLGIMDLVQFPATAKKTGELIVAGLDDEARLYYQDGAIEHIVCGEEKGLEGLVQLISWVEGEFEFRQGVTSDQSSISMPIDELLDKAAHEHTVRQEKEKLREAESSKSEKSVLDRGIVRIQQTIADACENLEYVEHVSLYDRDGSLICHWDREAFDELIHDLIGEVIDIFNVHPRTGLQKVYLTDTQGTSIATLVTDNLILLLTASELSSLGMVSLASSKIVQAVMSLTV